jgi:uncharacterized membrane protein YhaH (DUF805 family)
MAQAHDTNWLGWMVRPLRRYADFRGRSGRREFWWYSLFLFTGYMAILAITIGTTIAAPDSDVLIGSLLIGGWGFFFAMNFIPGLALTTRRLHDIGMSGAFLIAIFGGLLFLNVIAWIGYLVWMSFPSQRSENRYGPPLDEQAVADVFS